MRAFPPARAISASARLFWALRDAHVWHLSPVDRLDVLVDTGSMLRAELAFATPRKLPKAASTKGRVVVLDVAFASEASGGGFEKITKPFIEGLGPRLVAWVDHHDHVLHAQYKTDARFILATKAEHGACPEMVTPELCARVGHVDTIVCHTDFDGLCSAAKWLREGVEPYPGADDDARAIDTRLGVPSDAAKRFDRAIRARPRDTALLGIIVRHLATGLSDDALWVEVDAAGRDLAALEKATTELARGYRRVSIDKPVFPRCTSIAFLVTLPTTFMHSKRPAGTSIHSMAIASRELVHVPFPASIRAGASQVHRSPTRNGHRYQPVMYSRPASGSNWNSAFRFWA